jgi:hypothetical protein
MDPPHAERRKDIERLELKELPNGPMAYNAIMKVRLLLDTKTILADGRLIQRRVWQLPEPAVERPHGLKYRLYCGRNGSNIVRYDNELNKGDHKHVGPEEREIPYRFESLAKLFADFARDIETLSGEIT